MGRALQIAALAAVLVAVPGVATAAAAVESHPVDLRWSPDAQDIYPSQPVIVDEFTSTGPPFGSQAVETHTPRDQQFENTKRGKWLLYLKKRDVTQEPGVCKGTFEITKNYVETTATSQTVTYDGEIRLEGCRRTARFRRAQPGRLGKVTGRSVCTVGSCTGGLRIKGQIRY
jgi:hypothetical protein